jgi:predicted Zn-dependent protease
MLPQAPLVECLVFGLLFLVHATWLRAVDRRQPPATSAARRLTRMQWTSRAIVGGIVVAALTTHSMRRSREVQYETAARLLRLGQYTEALAVAEVADAWPSTARPGRLDVLRGEAYDGLGDKVRAEEFFTRAYRSDPSNFWAVADLAEFYASLNRPVDERRHLVEPLVRELRRSFPSEPALNDVMTRVADRLAGR